MIKHYKSILEYLEAISENNKKEKIKQEEKKISEKQKVKTNKIYV